MQIVDARNQTTHMYDQDIALTICSEITRYHTTIAKLIIVME